MSNLESKVRNVKTKADKIVRAGKAVGGYVAPYKYTPFEEHLEQARKYEGVEDILDQYTGQDREFLENRLSYHLEETRLENKRLKYTGATTDLIDKKLVPLDIIADASSFIGGGGYGISAAKEMVELPVKLFNTIYYAKKTKDYKAILTDGLYEVASFIVPGSLLDLTNRYSNRVDKYVAKEAARRFVKEAKSSKKGNVVRITEEFDQKAA